jgi:hypothetical protein
LFLARDNLGAHLAQRRDNTFHGAFLQRAIAADGGRKILPRQDAGEQSDRGAGVSRVQYFARPLQSARPVAGDANYIVFDFHIRAQRFDAHQGAVAVGGRGKMAKLGRSFGDSREHTVAVRNGFVSGQFDAPVDGLHGLNRLFFHAPILARRILRHTSRQSFGLRACFDLTYWTVFAEALPQRTLKLWRPALRIIK